MGNSQDPKNVLICQQNLIVLNSELGRTLSMTHLSRFPHGFDGLRIWQSGILLARYALLNREFFSGKFVLELGSGTGIAGLSVLKFTTCKNCMLSDYLPEVIENCRRNCRHNGMSKAIILKMNWKDSACFNNCYDIVMGADIVAPGGPNQAIYHCIKRFLLPGGTALFVIPQKKGYPEELLKHVEPAVFSVEHKELTGDNYLESPMPNKLEGFQCFPELVHEKHTLYILTKKGDVKELEANSELQHPPAYGKEIEVPYVPSKQKNPQNRPPSKTTIPPPTNKPPPEETKVVVIDTKFQPVDLSQGSSDRPRLKTVPENISQPKISQPQKKTDPVEVQKKVEVKVQQKKEEAKADPPAQPELPPKMEVQLPPQPQQTKQESPQPIKMEQPEQVQQNTHNNTSQPAIQNVEPVIQEVQAKQSTTQAPKQPVQNPIATVQSHDNQQREGTADVEQVSKPQKIPDQQPTKISATTEIEESQQNVTVPETQPVQTQPVQTQPVQTQPVQKEPTPEPQPDHKQQPVQAPQEAETEKQEQGGHNSEEHKTEQQGESQ